MRSANSKKTCIVLASVSIVTLPEPVAGEAFGGSSLAPSRLVTKVSVTAPAGTAIRPQINAASTHVMAFIVRVPPGNPDAPCAGTRATIARSGRRGDGRFRFSRNRALGACPFPAIR
jgi:hypothetical protein